MLYLFLSFVFLLGLIIGSFLNCLIWRLYKKEGMWNRSYCPLCRKQIAWYDNIPVFSFIILGGKCRHCRKKISWQYPIVELTVGLLFALAFYLNLIHIDDFSQIFNFKFLILNLRDWFLIAVMTVIFIYDLRWYLILDEVTLPALLLVSVANIFLGVGWFGLLVSAIIGGSFFLIQLLVSKGKWIGGGDIRLGLLMGAALGRFDLLIVALMLSYFSGSIVGVGLILLKGKKWNSQVPFGVFLSSATIVTIFGGQAILDWYLGLI